MPAPALRVVRRAAFRTVPWKNGGGVTHEAVRVPAAGDSFRWRLSVAEVATSGPFSDFSGYRRSMVLLQGQGLRLRFVDGSEALLREPGDLVEFDGGRGVAGELLAGPCTDLNLIVAQGLPDAGARVVRLDAALEVDCAAAETLLIFAVSAPVLVAPPDGQPPQRLAPWDLGIVSGGVAGTTRLQSVDAGSAAQVFVAKLRDNA